VEGQAEEEVGFHQEVEMQDSPGRVVEQLVEVGVIQDLLEDQAAEVHLGQATWDQ